MEQIIAHPSSVWAVSSLPTPGMSPRGSGSAGWYGSDIVTAGHDGVLRVFSADPVRTSRPLSLALQEDLARDVAEAAASRNKGPSAEEIAAAPKWEDRAGLPGTSEAQVPATVLPPPPPPPIPSTSKYLSLVVWQSAWLTVCVCLLVFVCVSLDSFLLIISADLCVILSSSVYPRAYVHLCSVFISLHGVLLLCVPLNNSRP